MIHVTDNTIEIYGILKTNFSKRKIANIFKKEGWARMASAWDEYEIESSDAELEIKGDGEILLDGLVNHYEKIIPA